MIETIESGREQAGLLVSEFRRIEFPAIHVASAVVGDIAVLPRSRSEVARETELLPQSYQSSRYLLTAAPLIASDILCLLQATLIGFSVVHALRMPGRVSGPPAAFPWACALVMLSPVFSYWRRGLYPAAGLHPVVELSQVVELNTAACLSIVIALLVARATSGWIVFVAVAWAASIVLVPLGRSLTRRLCARQRWWGLPTVVISSGNAARETVATLLGRPQSGLRPCYVIDPACECSGSILGVPRLAGVAAANGERPPGRPETFLAPYALVALPDLGRAEFTEVLETYRGRFPQVMLLSDVYGLPSLSRDSRDCGGGLAGTEFRNRALFPWPSFVKRSMDVALSLSALVFGLPLLAAVAAAVKLSSPGPVLFGHARLGRDGRSFKTWKFRTMRIDADAALANHLAVDPEARQEWERDHKLRNDPRVTPIGNFLRRTSLDELPQLWNVLVGEMSLVGPRPIVNVETARYGRTYRLYAEVRPGITGLWQVSGRNNTTYEERVRYDNFYVRNWSLWLDIHILARTIRVILARDGAY